MKSIFIKTHYKIKYYDGKCIEPILKTDCIHSNFSVGDVVSFNDTKYQIKEIKSKGDEIVYYISDLSKINNSIEVIDSNEQINSLKKDLENKSRLINSISYNNDAIQNLIKRILNNTESSKVFFNKKYFKEIELLIHDIDNVSNHISNIIEKNKDSFSNRI